MFEVDAILRLAFEAAPSAILWVNRAGTIQLVNRQVETAFGYSREELLGQSVELLVPERIRPMHVEYREGFFADPGIRTLGTGRDLCGRRKDGSEFPIEVGLNPVTLDGEVTVLATVIDITQRKHAEEELRALNVALESHAEQRATEVEARTQELARANEQLARERNLLKTLADSMPDAIYFKDKESRFIRANPGACRIFDVDSEDAVLGKTDADFFTSEEAEEYLADEQRIIATGEPLIGKEEYERWQDGEMHWVLTTKMALHDDAGNVIGTFGISRDITKLKQVEEALRQGEERFDLAARGSNDGLWDWDLSTGAEWWSPRFYELLGYEDGEVPATYVEFKKLLHPEDKERTLAAVQAHLEDHSRYDIEFRLLTKSGDYRWFSARGQAVWNKERAPVRMAGSLRDITDRLLAEQARRLYARDLEVANRDLQEFAYVVSHDLREPLRAVSGFCSLLERKYQGLLDDDGKEFMQHVVDGASRMSDLLDGLLKYSRVGTHGTAFERVDCNEALRIALANLHAAIKDSSANIEHDELPTLTSDKTQLVQLFQNLIANAIKYRGRQALQIHISATKDGGEWRFSVNDNGIGFDASHGERIFDIFQRLHTREQYSGMGVGLAICKRIVQRHGGRAWAESKPNVGSTFYFTIPEQNQGDRDSSIHHSPGAAVAPALKAT